MPLQNHCEFINPHADTLIAYFVQIRVSARLDQFDFDLMPNRLGIDQ